MSFNDFDIEVQDLKDAEPEHMNGTITTAGSPVSLSHSSGKPIQLAFLKNPNKGPNSNGTQDVIALNIDGTTVYSHFGRGEYIYIPGIFQNLVLDANNNGVNYEVILWA